MRSLVLVIFLACSVYFVVHTFIAAPKEFPAPYELVVENGDNSSSIAQKLYQDRIIKSSIALRAMLRVFGTDRQVSVGHYLFAEPINALDVALRISGNQFGINKKNVTFPEGYTVEDMAERLKEVFPEFNAELFISLAKKDEGYLFPDTYGFLPHITPEAVIGAMKETFDRKISPLEADITASGRTMPQIITMASIIEKEASGEEDAKTISGILWKRYNNGIRLEVDAAPKTYDVVGLPAKPIANPGLWSIDAALHPTASKYLYYLHDKEGNVHYASTYEEHKQNIQKYLK